LKNIDLKRNMKDIVVTLLDSLVTQGLQHDPQVFEHDPALKLHRAFMPSEFLKIAHLERIFVQQFHEIWGKLAVFAAQNGLGLGLQNHPIRGVVRLGRLRRIQEVLNKLEHPASGQIRTKPNWQSELDYILAGGGNLIPVTVVCDIYAEDVKNNQRFAFELKGPLPNSDQTKVSKEKLLKLYAMSPSPIDAAYYALPYNPYGSNKSDYSWAFPARWFDMTNDSAVLIGAEFWDKIGGVGTYAAFIDAINEIGMPYQERIYREFLGIEPPNRSRTTL
jgi:Type II restriction endonuclease, TdeIII